GEMYFNTSAPPGSNIVGCISTNNWVTQGAANSSSGAGAVTIKGDSVVVGGRAILNFIHGLGANLALSDTGQEITIQILPDTGVVQLRATAQSGASILCDAQAGPAYSCSLTPTLTTYSRGMILSWIPNIDCAANGTLNIDGVGPVPITRSDSGPL